MNKIIEFKKFLDGATVPYRKDANDISFHLTATDVKYDMETDQYVYMTGVMTIKPVDGVYCYIKPSNSLNDCYLSDYRGFGESDYGYGEIILTFKNRTSFKVRQMLEEWECMKRTVKDVGMNMEDSTENTIEKMKSANPEGPKVLDPMDYKPFEVGEEIAEVFFFNVSDVESCEAYPSESD